jgi:hypothetical protein
MYKLCVTVCRGAWQVSRFSFLICGKSIISLLCTVGYVDHIFGLIVLIQRRYGPFEFQHQFKYGEQFRFLHFPSKIHVPGNS